MAEWFRALVLQSGGPGFKPSTLPLARFVSRSSRVQILGHALYIANWSASSQLGFLIMLCSFKVICFLCFSGMPKLAISKLSA